MLMLLSQASKLRDKEREESTDTSNDISLLKKKKEPGAHLLHLISSSCVQSPAFRLALPPAPSRSKLDVSAR